MTPCPASGPISIAQIKAAFPSINSNSLSDYRGARWFKSDNSRGFFPSGANAYVSMSDFYDTRQTSPVVPGNSGNITSGSSYTLPSMFNTLSIELYGGGGGGGGGSYLAGTTGYNGSNGGSGGQTSFGLTTDSFYISAAGGGGGSGSGISSVSNYQPYGSSSQFPGFPKASYGGGSAGSAGAFTPDQIGVVGGGNGGVGINDNNSHEIVTSSYNGVKTTWTDYSADTGGAGGVGGKNVGLLFDIGVIGFSAISYFYNRSIPISIGVGGSGGLAGNNGSSFAFSGFPGSSGRIVISWT